MSMVCFLRRIKATFPVALGGLFSVNVICHAANKIIIEIDLALFEKFEQETTHTISCLDLQSFLQLPSNVI